MVKLQGYHPAVVLVQGCSWSKLFIPCPARCGCNKASAASLTWARGCCAVIGLLTTWGITWNMAGARGHGQ